MADSASVRGGGGPASDARDTDGEGAEEAVVGDVGFEPTTSRV